MSRMNEPDFGTPARTSAQDITLTIDGARVVAPAGTSIMAAAMRRGVEIPKLCATDMLEPFGSCRLCLVEIEGRRGTPASCTTPIEDGMMVRTEHYSLAATKGRAGDVWYDGDGRLVQAVIRTRGEIIEYRRKA